MNADGTVRPGTPHRTPLDRCGAEDAPTAVRRLPSALAGFTRGSLARLLRFRTDGNHGETPRPEGHLARHRVLRCPRGH